MRCVKLASKVEKLIKKWEKEYKADKAKEIEELHNAIGEVIANHPLPTILTTLRLIEHELLSSKIKQLEEGKPVEEVMKA